jgi:hypothetical protein
MHLSLARFNELPKQTSTEFQKLVNIINLHFQIVDDLQEQMRMIVTLNEGRQTAIACIIDFRHFVNACRAVNQARRLRNRPVRHSRFSATFLGRVARNGSQPARNGLADRDSLLSEVPGLS